MATRDDNVRIVGASRSEDPMRRLGLTVAELVVACTLAGLVAGIVVPRMADALDVVRISQASHEVAGAVTLARAAAIRRAEYARVVVDAPAGAVRVESGRDTLWRRDLRDDHHVTLRTSRDTITFAPNGLGYGVSNATIILSLGQRAETVTVSRLGRMRLSW